MNRYSVATTAAPPARTFTNVDLNSIVTNQVVLTIDITPSGGGSDSVTLDLSTVTSSSYSSGKITITGTGYSVAPSADYSIAAGDAFEIASFEYDYNYTYTSVANSYECVVDKDLTSEVIIDSGSGVGTFQWIAMDGGWRG